MLKIKLFPVGKKHQIRYRIVVSQARSKRDGKYLESLGFYDPNLDPPLIRINKSAFENWLKKGAQPTQTVYRLYKKL